MRFIFFLLIVSFGQNKRTSDQIRIDLNNAKFTMQIKKSNSIYFSNRTKQDTVVLVVDTGLIYQTKCYLSIKTFDNRVIFYEEFNTNYFTRGVFQPDTIPLGDQDVYQKFIDNYTKSITKKKIEKFALAKIQSFLRDIKVNRNELEQYKNGENVLDKKVYKQIMKDKSVRVVWFPCYEYDEGIRYFAYSKTKAKAIKIVESD